MELVSFLCKYWFGFSNCRSWSERNKKTEPRWTGKKFMFMEKFKWRRNGEFFLAKVRHINKRRVFSESENENKSWWRVERNEFEAVPQLPRKIDEILEHFFKHSCGRLTELIKGGNHFARGFMAGDAFVSANAAGVCLSWLGEPLSGDMKLKSIILVEQTKPFN